MLAICDVIISIIALGFDRTCTDVMLSSCVLVKCAQIENLPGLPENLNALKQFSGYLEVNPGRFIHYWYVILI